jgi:GNAT superfamily N-acetyltransferase
LSKETTILICVATSGIPLADEDTLIQGEWVGFAAVRGPISYKDYYESADQGLPVPADPNVETRWHVYDLYTLPSHRGRGLAKKLIAGCVDTAVELTRNSSHDHQLLIARIRLFMDRRKAWLVKMYEGLEFEGVGLVTLTEAIRANAFYESLPEDSQSTEELRHKWHARNGLAMERIVHIGQDVA